MTKKWNTHYLLRHILLLLPAMSLCSTALGAEFVHPSISHNSSELEFIKTKLKTKKQPWQQAWDQLRDSSYAKLSWKARPVANVERGAYNRPDIGGTFFLRDGTAAYTHTLIWWFTREEAHAAKAADILNAWSGTLESIGNHDARLLVGMGGINYCNAAELLKHTWGKWAKKDQDAFRTMLRQILYPVIEDFYPTANGNWDASMIQTMMAMGIYLDDLSMFQKAVDYFLEGEGNGAVNHYFNHFGQCQESGRDQAHTQMGLEYLVNSSEIAWKQGIDVYGAYDNRLAKGFEYTARYNLGEDVAFEYYESYRGRYKHHEISSKSRGRLRAMYEKAYNHYHNRMGMDMPWCKKAIEKTRPERGGVSSLPWSTLMYADQPAGLVTLEKSSRYLPAAQELRNNANPSQRSLIPRQANEYVWIYRPSGDHFFGPDTKHLKEGQWYDEWVPNDHTFVKDEDGKWHIMGITHPLVESNPIREGVHEGEFASFHAISSSTRFEDTLKEHHYSDLPKILPPKERPGEPLANHAPYIIKKDGLYYMIYGPNPFRLAVSSDLSKWELKGNLFHESDGARDPSLLLYNGTYYVVYCSVKSVRLRRSRDLIHWSEPETIFTSTGFDPESPSLIYFNESFYLLVCSWDGNWDGKDIQGAYQHITYVYHTKDTLNFGIDDEKQITTLKSHAPEIFQDEDGKWYISSVEWPYRGVSVDMLKWEE